MPSLDGVPDLPDVRTTGDLPHDDVFVRLGVSQINGVGVLAIRDIPQGADIFPNDRLSIRWVGSDSVIAIADAALRALYEDFAIRRNGKLGCPENFNSMTVGWYLNEAVEGEQPNVHAESDLHFTAARDIKAGEELTICYASFSDTKPV